jgi:hypothetical protein
MIKLVKPSTGTVAYFVNEQAQKLISSQRKLIGVADWPTWVYKVEFFESKMGFFDTSPQSESLIAKQMVEEYARINPTFRANFVQAILGLFNYQLTNDFGGHKYYIRGVLLPFMFKFLHSILPSNPRN